MIHHLIHGLGEGGAERVAAMLTAANTRSQTTRLLCLGPVHPDLKAFAPHIQSLGVPDDDHLPPGRRFSALARRAEKLRGLKGTALVAHDDASHEAAVLATADGGLPVVRIIHTALDWTPEDHRRAFHIYNAATRLFLCVEEKTFLQAKRIHLPAARMPQAIDLRRLRPFRIPKRKLRSKKTVNLLFVGRLEWAKGADVLIRALARLPRDIHLDMVGDGPERPTLQHLSERLKLTDRIRFRGYQSDVGRWYRSADLVVLPSRSEGVSLVMLEALAAGVPVVATAAGGNREMMKKFGLERAIAPTNHSEAMAKGILSVLDTSETSRTRWQESFKHVRQNHSAEKVRDWVEKKIASRLR